MSPELEVAATKLVESINSTGDFVVAQAPEVIQQFLFLGRFYCVLSFTLAILFPILIWKVSYRLYKTSLPIVEENGDRYEYRSDIEQVYLFSAWCSGLIFGFGTFVSLCRTF